MMEQPVPVHLAGVVTGQSRRSYVFGTVLIVGLMVGLALLYLPMVFALADHMDSALLRSYGLLGFNMLAMPVLAVVVRMLHRMRLTDLVAPARSLDWGMMGRSALVYAVPMLAQVLYGLWAGEVTVDRTLSLGLFLLLAPVTILAFGLQASAEELLFRGYLAQGAQVLFRHAVPSALLTALLFTLVHEGTGANAVWANRITIFLMALLLSWLTMRLGRLEAAMGLHIANNILVIWFNGSALVTLPALTAAVDPDPPDPVGMEWLWFGVSQVVVFGFYWLVGLKTGFVERGLPPRKA